MNTNNLDDVWLMMAFGVLGFLMYRYGYSPAGVLLGLILGPIAENGLRDLMVVSRGDPLLYTLQRPIALALVALIVLILFYSFKQQSWQKRSKDTINALEN